MLITLLHVLFHCTAALPQLKIAFSLHYYDDCSKGTATKSSFILWHNQIHFESPLFLSVSVQCTLVTLRAEYLIFFCFQFSELFLSLPLSSSLQSHLHVSISQANNATIKPVNDVKTILYHHQHHHHLIKVSPLPLYTIKTFLHTQWKTRPIFSFNSVVVTFVGYCPHLISPLPHALVHGMIISYCTRCRRRRLKFNSNSTSCIQHALTVFSIESLEFSNLSPQISSNSHTRHESQLTN